MIGLFHVAHPRWQPGDPLLPWFKCVDRGVFSTADWQHPKVPYGYDGDLVSFHDGLLNALTYAEGTSKTILRVWLWRSELVINREECYCVRGIVAPYRIEIVPLAWIASMQAWRDHVGMEARRRFKERNE